METLGIDWRAKLAQCPHPHEWKKLSRTLARNLGDKWKLGWYDREKKEERRKEKE